MTDWQFTPNGTQFSLATLSAEYDKVSRTFTIRDGNAEPATIEEGESISVMVQDDGMLAVGDIHLNDWQLYDTYVEFRLEPADYGFSLLRTGGGLGISDIRDGSFRCHVQHFNLRIVPIAITIQGNALRIDFPFATAEFDESDPHPLAFEEYYPNGQ